MVEPIVFRFTSLRGLSTDLNRTENDAIIVVNCVEFLYFQHKNTVEM